MKKPVFVTKGARVIAKKYHTKFPKTNYKTKQKWLV